MNVFIIYLSGLSLATQRGPYYETKNPIRQLNNAETDTFLDSLISLANAHRRPDRSSYRGQEYTVDANGIAIIPIDPHLLGAGIGKRDQFGVNAGDANVVDSITDTLDPYRYRSKFRKRDGAYTVDANRRINITSKFDSIGYAGGIGKRDQFPEEDQGDVVRAVGDTEFRRDASRTHARRSSSGESSAFNLQPISQEAPRSYTENNPFIFSHIIERKRRFAAPSRRVSPGGDGRQL